MDLQTLLAIGRARSARPSTFRAQVRELDAAVHGSLVQAGVSFPRTKRLPDGTTGYFVRLPRLDDCFAAALATTLEVPIEQVPDPRIDERMDEGESPEEISRSARDQLSAWLAERGLRVIFHDKVPVANSRWIGVVPLDGMFNDHSMVMSEGDVLFDPTSDLADPGTFRKFGAAQVKWGFSFHTTRR